MVISNTKANRLYWLGRYVERVYMTLHLLRRVYDKMIDGEPQEYEDFWKKMDLTDSYASTGEFTLGMMYDDENPCSILSSLNCAMDNAIMLREDIKSETMSYIEMSIALIKKYKSEAMSNVTNLQSVTDWMLAFGGSLSQRVDSPKVLSLIAIGQKIEKMDIMLRYGYCSERIAAQYYILKNWAMEWPELLDAEACARIEDILNQTSASTPVESMKWTLCENINKLIKA